MGFAKKFFIAFFTTLVLASPFFLILGPVVKPGLNVYQKALAITYFLQSGEEPDAHYGSGVLLSGGFILTNRHVADFDDSGYIDNSELVVKTTSSIGEVCSAIVVFQPVQGSKVSKDDWCVLYVGGAEGKSKLKVAKHRAVFGEEIFTIGHPDAESAEHLYVGYKSIDIRVDLERGSLTAFPGSSGGGVFNKNGELLGLLTAGRLSTQISFVPALVPQWAEYVSIFTIKEDLEKAGYGQILD